MGRRSVAEFLDKFVLPFVRGGEMIVGNPIDSDDMQAFEQDLPHASVELVAVDEARTDVLSEIVVRPPPLVLDVDDLRLAAAVYNLLFLVHPGAERWSITTSALKQVAETAKRFASRPRSTDRTRVLARHGLLHNLFDLSRVDTTVSWWTGKATFFGQHPPRRLTAWGGVRRVHSESNRAGFARLLAHPDAMPVVAALLRRSPMTLLVGAPRLAPPVHWEDSVFVLRDAELARAVAYAALAPRELKMRVAGPARFAAAFEQMLERNPDESAVRAVAAFLVHLNVLLALAEVGDRNQKRASALLTSALAPERAGQRPRGLATFFALPNALAAVDPRLAQPPGLRGDPALLRRWQHHRAQVAEGVGEAVIEALAGRLQRRLPGAPKQLEVGDNPG